MARNLFSIAVPLTALLPFACFSTPPTPPRPQEAGTYDASQLEPQESGAPDATAETSATVEAAADAPATVEAAVDAPIDAPLAPVIISVVTPLGTPEAGVVVVFDDAQGAYLSSATTDVTGTVTQIVAAGSQATALLGDPSSAPDLVTFVGIEPGDVLTVLDTSTAPAPQTVTISALPSNTFPSFSYYDARAGGCGSTTFVTPPGSVLVQGDCSAAGVFPLLVTAYGDADAGYAPVGFTFLNGNALATDGGAPSVALAGSWSTTMGTLQVTGSHLPGYNVRAVFSEVSGGVPFDTSGSLSYDYDAGTGAASFVTHPGYADFVQTEISEYVNVTSGCSTAAVGFATRGAPPANAGTLSFDLSQALPAIQSATVAAPSDAGVSGLPPASWSPTASLAATAGSLVQVPWTATVDGSYLTGTWTFIVPPTVTSVQAPALPASASAWVPSAGSYFGSNGAPIVITVDGDGLASYAALRHVAGPGAPTALRTFGRFGANQRFLPPLPNDGTLRFSAFYVSGC